MLKTDPTDQAQAITPNEYLPLLPRLESIARQLTSRNSDLRIRVASGRSAALAFYTPSSNSISFQQRIMSRFLIHYTKIDFFTICAAEIGLLIHECGHSDHSPDQRQRDRAIDRLNLLTKKVYSRDQLNSAYALIEEVRMEYKVIEEGHYQGGQSRTAASKVGHLTSAVSVYLLEDGIDVDEMSTEEQAVRLAVLIGGRYLTYSSALEHSWRTEGAVSPILKGWGETALGLLSSADRAVFTRFFSNPAHATEDDFVDILKIIIRETDGPPPGDPGDGPPSNPGDGSNNEPGDGSDGDGSDGEPNGDSDDGSDGEPGETVGGDDPSDEPGRGGCSQGKPTGAHGNGSAVKDLIDSIRENGDAVVEETAEAIKGSIAESKKMLNQQKINVQNTDWN